jgi:hypothetical protein
MNTGIIERANADAGSLSLANRFPENLQTEVKAQRVSSNLPAAKDLF